MIDADDVKVNDSDVPFEKLYQALIECFGIIICGYVAGRLGIISTQQTNGLATFVGTFSLPSLIFMSLATLDLSSVCWYFLLSIFVSKAIIFTSVLAITLLVTRPVDASKAGLYAIFCTQSNDFAIGFPIVLSAYGKTHPEYVSYLYLLAPISLVMLNPIGFMLMEIGKRKSQNISKLQLFARTLGSIAANPIVFMTALGIIGNLVFHHNVPPVIGGLLNVFGSAFTASALFLLGLHMVGKVQSLQGAALIVPAILITVKELVLPILTREVTSLILHSISYNSSSSVDMTNYGFLYGTFPTAPGVFVYATSYSLDVDLIACAMVACTFLSAPLMFISAKMVSVSNLSPSDLFPSLTEFEFDLSIFGVFACIWLIGIFFAKKNYSQLPQRITLFLVVSQMIGCIGVLVGHIILPSVGYLKYALMKFGDSSATLWTAVLGMTLLLIESKNLALLQTLQPIFVCFVWGVPVVIILCLVIWVSPSCSNSQCSEGFMFGHVEAGITILLLLISFIVSVSCIIIQQRYKRRYRRYLIYVRETSSSSEPGQCINSTEILQPDSGNEEDNANLVQSHVEEENTVESISTSDCSQPLHHLILMFFLVGSTFVSLALCVWILVMEEITGVYVELSFLDVILKRGQSIIVLFIFGLDTIAVIQPLLQRLKDFWSVGDPIQLLPWEELPFETQHLCELFAAHNLDKCKSEIVRNQRTHLWHCKPSFTGDSFVSWLISERIVKDRAEGTAYASHLLSGRIIQHVTNSQFFTDDYSLFIFLVPE